MDIGKTSDPYVVIKYKDQQYKTKIIKKTLQPVWNEDFVLFIENANDVIIIEVWDWERIGGVC